MLIEQLLQATTKGDMQKQLGNGLRSRKSKRITVLVISAIQMEWEIIVKKLIITIFKVI